MKNKIMFNFNPCAITRFHRRMSLAYANKRSNGQGYLFLWVVNPMLPEGIETLKRWGFKFKTVPFVG